MLAPQARADLPAEWNQRSEAGEHGGTALRRHHTVNEARAGAQLLLMDG